MTPYVFSGARGPSIYELYVAQEQAAGRAPLSLDEWIASTMGRVNTESLLNIAALQTYERPESVDVVTVAYQSLPTDGLGGQYWFDGADDSTPDDGLNVIVNQSTGARWKRISRVYNRSVDITQFGAAVDGTTDDSGAITDLIDWLEGRPTGETVDITSPRGVIRLGKAVDFSNSTTGGWFNRSFRMRGAGRGVTRCLVDNPVGGFLFEGNENGRAHEIAIENMTFLANRPNAGVGFSAVLPGGGNQHHRTLTMRGVEFQPVDKSEDYFSVPIRAHGQWRALIDDVLASGPYGPGSPIPPTQTTTLLSLDDTYAPAVTHFRGWGAATGISLQNAVQAEGFTAENIKLVEVGVGLDVGNSLGEQEPGFDLTRSHINPYTAGVILNGRKFGNIDRCRIYQHADSEAAEYIDIDLVNASHIKVENNNFQLPVDSGSRVGARRIIKVRAASSLIKIGENQARNFTTMIDIEAGVTPGTVSLGTDQYELLEPGDEYVRDVTEAAVVRNIGYGEAIIQESADGANSGPTLRLHRRSASPAANDKLGEVIFSGVDDAGNDASYARIAPHIVQATDGGEDAELQLVVIWDEVEYPFLTIKRAGANDDFGIIMGLRTGTSEVTQKRLYLDADGVTVKAKNA